MCYIETSSVGDVKIGHTTFVENNVGILSSGLLSSVINVHENNTNIVSLRFRERENSFVANISLSGFAEMIPLVRTVYTKEPYHKWSLLEDFSIKKKKNSETSNANIKLLFFSKTDVLEYEKQRQRLSNG